MPRGIISALLVACAVTALAAGCEGPSARQPTEPPRPPIQVTPAPPRVPERVGDYIIYPLKWRNPYETACQLQALLYPKYGPFVQIIPDPDTDSLWIYLPPRGTRFQDRYPSM